MFLFYRPNNCDKIHIGSGFRDRVFEDLRIVVGLFRSRCMDNLDEHYAALLGLTSQWKVIDVDLSLLDQRVEIAIEWGGGLVECPECGKDCTLHDHREERKWRHLDTMQFETILRCRVPRAKCTEHGVHTVRAPWAEKHSRFTLMFEAFAIRILLACKNVDEARKLLKISWTQADEIRRRAVERGLAQRNADQIQRLGIDEKSFGKHHQYVTVMTDLDRSCVLDVAPERTQKAAEGLLLTLDAQQRESVLAIALDMWPAYMNAASNVLPNAVAVHDKFHVSKHLNEAVDQVRKQEHKVLMQQGDDSLKGAKYLFLKNPDNIKKSQRDRFVTLKQSSLKTARAWAIKEQFKEFWSFEFGSDARAFFKQWNGWTSRCRLQPIVEKGRMLRKHLDGLLGYILHPVTNAANESLNSKIQYIKASARGFRSFARYRTAILFYCGKLNMYPDTILGRYNFIDS